MKLRPPHILLAVAVVAIIAMAAVVTGGEQPGSVRQSDGAITKIVSRVEPNATATFDIVLQEGNDAAHESSHIFSLFEHPAVAKLVLDTEALALTIEYDGAGVTEDYLRSQLASAGYVKRTAADATPTEMLPDGSGQTIHLVPGDALTPSLVHAAAGVPLTITFSAGTGHLASVTIPALGISQSIITEGATISIPNPVPGEYDIVCEAGYSDAVLIVD